MPLIWLPGYSNFIEGGPAGVAPRFCILLQDTAAGMWLYLACGAATLVLRAASILELTFALHLTWLTCPRKLHQAIQWKSGSKPTTWAGSFATFSRWTTPIPPIPFKHDNQACNHLHYSSGIDFEYCIGNKYRHGMLPKQAKVQGRCVIKGGPDPDSASWHLVHASRIWHASVIATTLMHVLTIDKGFVAKERSACVPPPTARLICKVK